MSQPNDGSQPKGVLKWGGAVWPTKSSFLHCDLVNIRVTSYRARGQSELREKLVGDSDVQRSPCRQRRNAAAQARRVLFPAAEDVQFIA